MAAAKVAKTKKKKITQSIDKGQVHIKSSFNNTVVTFTDMAGNVLSWSSSGKLGFKGSKKSTPFAAQSSVEDAAKVAKDYGIKTVEVYVKGPGNGREAEHFKTWKLAFLLLKMFHQSLTTDAVHLKLEEFKRREENG